MPDWKKTKEGKAILRQRKMAQASLDFSRDFEEFRKKHKLGVWQTVELLREQMDIYICSGIKTITMR